MTNGLGIAAVTAVLKDHLDNGLADPVISSSVGSVAVSALPPDRVFTDQQSNENRLNLFLHRVSSNTGWKNVDLPSRDAQGSRLSNPPLALNLHYLLTANGADDFFGEILLGYGMQLFHDQPVMTRDKIQKALQSAVPPTLATTGLALQVEQIKITLEDLGTEELSKLWSATLTHYRPTAAYQVSVLLIQSEHSTKSSLPVKGSRLKVVPLIYPFIQKVLHENGGFEPIVAGSVLLIRGHGLKGETTEIFMGPGSVAMAAADITSDQIKIPLPVPLPAGLYAGVQTVRVVHQVDLSQPNEATLNRHAFESNIEPFVLRPSITVTDPVGPISAVVDGVAVKSGELNVQFNPVVHKAQQVLLLLNEITPTEPAHAYSFSAPQGNGISDPATETQEIAFPFENVAEGDYLVRVRVDGAESPVAMVSSDVYNDPSVQI